MRRSLKIDEKLTLRLNEDPVVEQVIEIIDSNVLGRRFNTMSEFKKHLSEGALLNVGKIASQALSVPCGDYMVWMTDAGHTMLVPVSSAASKPSHDVLEHDNKQYDIFTRVLLQNWSHINKTLSEAREDEEDDDDYDDLFDDDEDADDDELDDDEDDDEDRKSHV